MALQGTIDSFALADVLRLLNASAKSGRLIVNGDRGSASLWIADGEIVGGATSSDPHTPDPVDVVFDVLRYQHGSFIFENDARCPSPGEPLPIVPVLEQAEAALAEWFEIVRVVPSLQSVVVLADELPHPEVVVDQACWTSIVAVGSGITVEELGATLGLGELPVSRLVRALVAAGFVEVTEVAVPAAAESGTGALGDTESTPEEFGGSLEPTDGLESTGFESTGFESTGFESTGFEPASFDSEESTTGFVPLDDAFTPQASFGSMPVEDPGITITGLSDDPFGPDAFGGFERSESTPDDGAGEEDWNQALSMLSPKAAQAVAAASDDTRPAPGFEDGTDEAFRGA